MKFTLQINQHAASELGLEGIVDIVDLAIFDSFKSFANSPSCHKLHDDNGAWFWIAYAEIIRETPFIPIKTNDGIYRRMKKLELAKIIEFHPDNKKLGRTYFRWGECYHKMEFKSTDNYPEGKNINRTGTDNYPEVGPDKKPDNHNTNKTSKTKTNDLAGAKPRQGSKEKSDGVIHGMRDDFEAEHKKHFKDAAGNWIKFTWQKKEFGALESFKKEIEKRYYENFKVEPRHEDIRTWLVSFLSKAIQDQFTRDKLFTPTKLWGNFQIIVQKIHENANGKKPNDDKTKRIDAARRIIAA